MSWRPRPEVGSLPPLSSANHRTVLTEELESSVESIRALARPTPRRRNLLAGR